ncbi:hypothetical protein ACFYTB_21615 [Bacillus velezensis]
MMPLQVELQRNVKATKDEAMTVEQAAELLKVHPDYIPTLVARSDDLKMIGDTIIAKRDKMKSWPIWLVVMALFVLLSTWNGLVG